MEWTFPVATPLRADLELQSGDIEVLLEPTNEVRVTLEPVGRMTDRALEQINNSRVSCDDGHLIVQVPKRWLREDPLRMTVLIPPDSTLTCSAASADVKVRGKVGPFGARTASGDMYLDGQCDHADVATASGDVRMAEVLGEARVKTASGDVTVGHVGGRSVVDSASGDVRVSEAGSDARVRTASGDVSLSRVMAGDVEINTASGDVRVGVAEGVGVWLDIVTVSGSTKCNLPSDDGIETDAGLRLSCRTVSGDVLIESAKNR